MRRLEEEEKRAAKGDGMLRANRSKNPGLFHALADGMMVIVHGLEQTDVVV